MLACKPHSLFDVAFVFCFISGDTITSMILERVSSIVD